MNEATEAKPTNEKGGEGGYGPCGGIATEGGHWEDAVMKYPQGKSGG